MMETVLQGLASLFVACLTAALGVLIPHIRAWLQERVVASMNARIGAAAETVAVEMATAVGGTVQASIESGVETLKERLSDTIAKLDPADSTLAGILKKARLTVAAKAAVVANPPS